MRLVLITHDSSLAEEVSRLAAAAGAAPEVLGAEAVLGAWLGASVVLVGADVAGGLASAQLEHRGGVHVVALGSADVEAFRHAVRLGASGVVELPASEDWLVQLLTDIGEPPMRGTVIGVIGGAGGVGTTTVACAVAQVAAESASTLLVDLDRSGPGLDRVLGLELHDGVRWEQLIRAPGRLSARSLRDAVPRHGQLGVLTWGTGAELVPPATVREALLGARRGHDVVVLDAGRGAPSGGEASSDVLRRCDALVVVTPGTVIGLAATGRVLATLGDAAQRAVLVLRPGPVAADQIEHATGLRVVAALRDVRGIGESLDLGLGPVRSRRGPVARAARAVLGEVA